MQNCFLCDRPAHRGALCENHAAPLDATEAIVPEQVVSRPRLANANACVIDALGRAHELSETNVFGRESADINIFTAAVSRRHAVLESTPLGWTIRDCESHNGTFVGTEAVHGPAPVQPGDLIRVANIGFLFALGRPDDDDQDLDVATRPISSGVLPGDNESIHLLEPTRGGGGLLEVQGESIQITLIQFALMRILLDRLRADHNQPPAVRGFVPSIELLANLPWATSSPEDAHLKQVVRRLRRRISDTKIGIEGRRGFGYRLTLGNNTDEIEPAV
jgi:hypothetical protein